MLTIDKFRDAVTTHFAWSRSLVWTSLALGIALFGSVMIALESVLSEGDAQSYARMGLVVALFLLLPVVGGLAAWCNEGRMGCDERLICPCCGGLLQLYAMIVIATRNCPHCGQRVLSEPGKPA